MSVLLWFGGSLRLCIFKELAEKYGSVEHQHERSVREELREREIEGEREKKKKGEEDNLNNIANNIHKFRK